MTLDQSAQSLKERPVVYRGLAEAARLWLGGTPPHVATLRRWGTVGVLLRDGSRLKLKLTRLPGRWVVSEAAIREFIDTLTADRTGEQVGV